MGVYIEDRKVAPHLSKEEWLEAVGEPMQTALEPAPEDDWWPVMWTDHGSYTTVCVLFTKKEFHRVYTRQENDRIWPAHLLFKVKREHIHKALGPEMMRAMMLDAHEERSGSLGPPFR